MVVGDYYMGLILKWMLKPMKLKLELVTESGTLLVYLEDQGTICAMVILTFCIYKDIFVVYCTAGPGIRIYVELF